MYSLQLADGCNWQISAETPETQSAAARLAEIMSLPKMPAADQVSNIRHLCLSPVDTYQEAKTRYSETIIAARSGETARVPTSLKDPNPNIQIIQLSHCSAVIGLEAQQRGGALVHGALAAYPTHSGLSGILLCAPSGTGKTTASNRLPPPWISLCDDTTLVVRRPNGKFWAHPLPTWSRFPSGENGGCWDTPRAVPLQAIFFLQQAQVDQVVKLNTGHAVVSLTNVIKQASQHLMRRMEQSLACTIRNEWFVTACELTQALSAYQLNLSLAGNFWYEIEKIANFSYDKEK